MLKKLINDTFEQASLVVSLYERKDSKDGRVQDEKFDAFMMQISDYMEEVKRLNRNEYDRLLEQPRMQQFQNAFNNRCTGNTWWSFVDEIFPRNQ